MDIAAEFSHHLSHWSEDRLGFFVFCRTFIPSPQPFGVGYFYSLPNPLMQRGGSRSSAASGSPKNAEMLLACLIDPADRLPARFS